MRLFGTGLLPMSLWQSAKKLQIFALDKTDITQTNERSPTSLPNTTHDNLYQDERELDESPSTIGFFLGLRILSQISSIFDWIMPFDHQQTFKRGAIHALDGKHLFRSAISVSEMWVIGLGLLLGVCVELWGNFPDLPEEAASSPDDYRALANMGLVYNILAYLTCCFCLMDLVVFAVSFLVAFTVDSSNFNLFMLLTLRAQQFAELLLVVTFYGFFVIAWIYLYAQNYVWVETYREILNDVNHRAISIGVGGITFVLFLYAYYNLNILARIAFHCNLMSPDSVRKENPLHHHPQHKSQADTSRHGHDHHGLHVGKGSSSNQKPEASQIERREVARTLQGMIHSPDNVMDAQYSVEAVEQRKDKSKQSDPEEDDNQGTMRRLRRLAANILHA